MMYDYYLRKFEAFYARFKPWILTAAALFFVVGIASRFWPQDRETQIKSALAEHHEKAGQRIKIESLDFRAVDPTAPDSIRWKEAFAKGRACSDVSLAWLRAGVSDKSDRYQDSMRYYYSLADKIADQIKADAPNQVKGSFTRCLYSGRISTSNESYSDTFAVILNDKLRVVWPDEK